MSVWPCGSPPSDPRACACFGVARVRVASATACVWACVHKSFGHQYPGGGGGNSCLEKNFRGGLGSRALHAKKKLSHYFHNIWNFFLQGVGGQISCGKLVNAAALQFVTLLTMNDLKLFSCICGYCALSCGVEERLFVRGGLL